MNKIFSISMFSLFFLFSTCHADEIKTENNTEIKSTDINSIDREIESLEVQLKSLRKDAFNKEMNAQPYMFDNWSEYREKINANEDDEKQILNIKHKIEELKNQKQSLK